MQNQSNYSSKIMEYVILDIETTGLDPENASIIDIGAILIKDSEIINRFSSLVEYKGIIPETTKRITGISESMLVGVPKLEEVLKKLKDFISKRPVVSHNGFSFDFPMLEKNGFKFVDKYDSMEFAFFVMPTYPHGHSMGALSQYFNLPEIQHRSLSDCEAEFKVINKLQSEFIKKPKKKREALKHITQTAGWWWSQFLPGNIKPLGFVYELVDKYEPYRKKNVNQEILSLETKPIELADLESKFKPHIGNKDNDYSEDRPEQRKMASLVAQAFNEQLHAVIEAGTGTGKSKAYLVPSILFSRKNGIPVIISTHTKALQDQLFFKEIPHLKETIYPNLRVAVLKGKQNYVCVRKFEEFFDEIITGLSQRSLYEFGDEGTRFTTRLSYLLLVSWLAATDRGDWDELPYWLKERIPKRIESDICNTDELCGNGTCDLYDEQCCFLAKARMRAKDADLVIINHALALSGIVIEGNDKKITAEDGKPIKNFKHAIFPNEARYIIFDEAHHLEDNATSAWEYRVSNKLLQFLLQQLYWGKHSVKNTLDYLAKRNQKLADFANRFSDQENDIKIIIASLFERYLPSLIPNNTENNFPNYCVLDSLSIVVKKGLTDSINELTARLNEIDHIISSVREDTGEVTHRSLTIRILAVRKTIKSLQAMVDNSSSYTRYLERSGNNIEIKSSPISVAEHIKSNVLDNFSSVVMTSATLVVDNGFRFFVERCGVSLCERSKVLCQQLPSSFNYLKQVKFFAPVDIAYNSSKKKQHFEKSAAFLERAIISSSGGALILCSSHEQVENLYQKLNGPLSKNNIWLLRQSKGSSISSILRDFKKDVNSVLIGTETLWQGIDIPGESLRSLFIYKIPYRMPEIPIIRARCEKIRSIGRDDFSSYYEPLAAIILKQGFGRLIRKSTDIGVVVLLDERIMQKERIRRSLPEGVRPVLAEPEFIYKELERIANLATEGKFNVDGFNA